MGLARRTRDARSKLVCPPMSPSATSLSHPRRSFAPMAGVTDTVFRRFIKNASQFTASSSAFTRSSPMDECHPERSPEGAQSKDLRFVSDATDINQETTNQQSGCGLIMTEFTSADGLSPHARDQAQALPHLLRRRTPHLRAALRLQSRNPRRLRRIVEDAGFDIVDLNLGCPAKRVVACNGGSGLLKDLPQIERIFKAIRSAVTIPFTVKFRMGWNDAHIVCVELAKMAEDCGLNACALHARTREDGSPARPVGSTSPPLKDAVKIPVIGNGDIRTPKTPPRWSKKTNCDAVMIGRTAPANRWIFRQIAQYTASKDATGVGNLRPPDQLGSLSHDPHLLPDVGRRDRSSKKQPRPRVPKPSSPPDRLRERSATATPSAR